MTAALALLLCAGVLAADQPVPLKSSTDKASYGIGMNIGRRLRQQGLELNAAALAKGLKDAFTNSKTQLTEAEAQEAIQVFEKAFEAKEKVKLQAEGAKNETAGAAFLAANKKKPGVKTLADGLQYKILKQGNGPIPKATDVVKVNYRGTLIDGTVFDSSYKRHQPATFPVNHVISGWTEVLQHMPVGSKWKVFIPSKLAYGTRGAPPVIGPNAVLVFDIELLGIEPQPSK